MLIQKWTSEITGRLVFILTLKYLPWCGSDATIEKYSESEFQRLKILEKEGLAVELTEKVSDQ